MRTLSTNTEQIKLRELIEAARKEPVSEPAVVVLSPAEFDRLDEQDRIRREAKASARDDRCDSPGRERARSDRDGA
jgi:hypothetical protein